MPLFIRAACRLWVVLAYLQIIKTHRNNFQFGGEVLDKLALANSNNNRLISCSLCALSKQKDIAVREGRECKRHVNGASFKC